MAVVGPGTQQEITTDRSSLLDGASEFEYVTLLNPLSDDFAIKVAQDVPVNMPIEIRAGTGLVQTERDVTSAYGLQLKNPDFQGRKHISNSIVIESGKTINLKGSEAQVALRQLVNELMQREGNTRLLSDPVLRRQAEARIVQHRGNIQELMDESLVSQRSQIDAALSKSNEVHSEQPFPGLNRDAAGQDADGSEDSGTDGDTQDRRNTGRPKKTG